MNFFDQIINKFQIISDPLSFIGVLFTIIVSLYIFKHENSYSFVRERHDKIIFPLFNLLEPFLYHDVPKETLESALQIIESNKNLIDGKLLGVSYFCAKNPSRNNLNELFSYVDRAYDKSCRKLGLKTRTFSYRFSRKQYKNVTSIILHMVVYTLFGLIVFAIFLFVFLYVVAVLYALYESLSSIKQLIMLLLVSFLVIVLNKYMEKFH